METTYRKPHWLWLSTALRSRSVMLCVLMIEFLVPPLFAQRPRMTYKSTPQILPKTPDDRVSVDNGDAQPTALEKKTCSIQPFPGIPDTVSVTSLQIPSKAQKEYEEACAALKKNHLTEVERHLIRATKIYPKYVVGWVMLGQVLEARQQTAKARDACSQASIADSRNLAAYLCLAEIAGREQKWRDVLSLTARALELDPVNDAYAYFFSAIAYFNLNRLIEAETNALKAEGIDKNHDEPLLQLLLSQIYEAKHDSASAAAHLRQYLELAPDSEILKKDLAEGQSLK